MYHLLLVIVTLNYFGGFSRYPFTFKRFFVEMSKKGGRYTVHVSLDSLMTKHSGTIEAEFYCMVNGQRFPSKVISSILTHLIHCRG